MWKKLVKKGLFLYFPLKGQVSRKGTEFSGELTDRTEALIIGYKLKWYWFYWNYILLFLRQERPHRPLCLFVHMCHHGAALCPCGDPALTPAVAELHCHVAFGSDSQSGHEPDRSQPFPRSPGGNVTTSIKTWACCLRFILNPSCTSQIAPIWSWTLVRKVNSLQWREDVCLLQYISSSRPQL